MSGSMNVLGSQIIKEALLVLVISAGVVGQFTNEVLPPTNGKIKEFKFVIEHRLGMVLYNDNRESGTPVIINSQGAFKRNGTSTLVQECDNIGSLTNQGKPICKKKKHITDHDCWIIGLVGVPSVRKYKKGGFHHEMDSFQKYGLKRI